MLAYSISPSAAAAASASGTPASSLLAGRAGTARMTASASSRSGARVGPMVSRQPGPRPPPGPPAPSPVAARVSSRVIALVRTVAPDTAAIAGGSVPRPPDSVVNTGAAGRVASGAGSRDATAAVRERCCREAWASAGRVASADSSSDRPA